MMDSALNAIDVSTEQFSKLQPLPQRISRIPAPCQSNDKPRTVKHTNELTLNADTSDSDSYESVLQSHVTPTMASFSQDNDSRATLHDDRLISNTVNVITSNYNNCANDKEDPIVPPHVPLSHTVSAPAIPDNSNDKKRRRTESSLNSSESIPNPVAPNVKQRVSFVLQNGNGSSHAQATTATSTLNANANVGVPHDMATTSH